MIYPHPIRALCTKTKTLKLETMDSSRDEMVDFLEYVMSFEAKWNPHDEMVDFL